MSDLSGFRGALPAWDLDRPLEEQLLLLCIRTRLDESARISAQRLTACPEFDWSRFLRLAIRHGVVPLTHAQLDALTSGKMPRQLRVELENRNRATIFRNLQLSGELLRLDTALVAEGIHPVWFKGPVLAQQLFSSILLREFSDLDVLVPVDRVGCANRILRERGYTPAYELTSPRQQLLHQRISNEHCFRNPRTDVCVDLHWALTENVYSFSNRETLTTCTIELAGHRIRTFGREETLCYLCYHASKHGWAVFRWISDVAEFLRLHPEIDWKPLIAGRLAIGTPRMLQVGLLLANSCLAAPLPTPVITWTLSDRKVLKIGREILARNDMPAKLFESSVYIGLMSSLSDRLRYWAAIVSRPSPLELEVVSLPDSLFFLYVLLRYIRLARKYARKLGATFPRMTRQFHAVIKLRCIPPRNPE